MIRLFDGLGNPGPEYEATRHNAGCWWIDAVARELKLSLSLDRSYHGLVARGNVHGQTVWLLEPQTFMNLSGKSVAALARFFKIKPHEIPVAHDELDVVPGQAKLKLGGSHAGHNGLRSIVDVLGTDEFPRIRIGIREGELPEDLAEYVLSDFPEDQVLVVQEMVGQAAEAADCLVREGAAAAMNRFNGPRRN